MSKKYRNLGLAVGALALFAAVAPGLAAGIDVPKDGQAPAAGQGAVTVQGFEVTNIDWTVDDSDSKVTEVSFTISRSATGAATVSASADGDGVSDNAVVRVRLEGTTNAEWAGCDVTNDAATCTLPSDAQMLASDLEEVNIIAYDRN
jgi:hypothetical protein